MSIHNSRKEGILFILFWLAVIVLIGVTAQVARSQEGVNFDLSKADSIWIVQYNDSLYQLAAILTLETREEIQVKTKPSDSLSIARDLLNIGTQSNGTVMDAYRILFERRRIARLTRSISDALQAFTGRTYWQQQELTFINELAPCNSSGSVCEAFYTFAQEDMPNRIIRIRSNGSIREVNILGQAVTGGIQGNIKLNAGAGLFTITINAGPADLINKELEFALSTQPTVNGNRYWRTSDFVFKLVQRKRLNDVGANFVD